MPKHTWKTSVVSDNGQGPTDSIDVYGSKEDNIGSKTAGVKGLAVGATDVEKVSNLNIQVADIQSFFIKATTNMRMRVNSETVPVQEVDLTANQVFGWNAFSIPQPSSNPLTVNITSLYFYNKNTTTTGLVSAGFLTNEDSQTS